jgi:hypothetical protein
MCGADNCGRVFSASVVDLPASRRAHERSEHPGQRSYTSFQCLVQPGLHGALVRVSGGAALGSATLSDTVRASTPERSPPGNPSRTEFYAKEGMWLHDHECVPQMQALQLPNQRACVELLQSPTRASPAGDRMVASIYQGCAALVERMQHILAITNPTFREQIVQLGARNAPGFKQAPLRPLENPEPFIRGLQGLVQFLYLWRPNTERLSLQWWDPEAPLDEVVEGVARVLHALALESTQNPTSDRTVLWSFIRARCIKASRSDPSTSAAGEASMEYVYELQPPSVAQKAGAQALRAVRYGTAYLAVHCKDGTCGCVCRAVLLWLSLLPLFEHTPTHLSPA